ncbi:hypothetical protein [Bacillus cereus]|uniref:hypothetical protein n=1 Tax=Bacillus cereus TaxID=1396 RepID=UPI000B4BFCDC|nr:hypothetical protein [Bacillus cereus]
MTQTIFDKMQMQIENLEKKIKDLKKIQELANNFPSLKEVQSSSLLKYYVASEVNTQVDSVELRFGCSCCSDALLKAYFYKTINGVRIYADPHEIAIGRKNPSNESVTPFSNWTELLDEHKIPNKLHFDVIAFFNDNRPDPEGK